MPIVNFWNIDVEVSDELYPYIKQIRSQDGSVRFFDTLIVGKLVAAAFNKRRDGSTLISQSQYKKILDEYADLLKFLYIENNILGRSLDKPNYGKTYVKTHLKDLELALQSCISSFETSDRLMKENLATQVKRKDVFEWHPDMTENDIILGRKAVEEFKAKKKKQTKQAKKKPLVKIKKSR